MILNITYGANVASAPAEFKTAVAAVQQLFETTFTNPVTVNIQVDYAPLGHDGLGASTYELKTFSFSQITTQLAAHSKSVDDAFAIASLPTADPIPGTHHYVMTTAEAKALGLRGASTALDGTTTFASNARFDYDRSDGITAGQYDFQGTVAHEFSEIMGRELNAIGNEVQTGEANGYYPYDLFKFTAEGARSFVGTTPGYFSLDNGTTNLNDFNVDKEGDFGDWAASAGDDSFLAFSGTGVVNAVTPTDLRVMDVLGWDLAFPVVDVTGHGTSGGGGNRSTFVSAPGTFVDGPPGPLETTTHHGHAVAAAVHAPHVAAVPVAPGAGPMDWHIA
jgi:hypothetical protein